MMKSCKFGAVIKKFSASQAEEGGQATMRLSLSMAEVNRKALAALCKNPEDASAALDAAAKTEGKLEIPCGQEVCALTVTAGAKKHDSPGVHFRRILLDSRGGECQMRISCDEPKTAAGGSFYLANVGQQVEFAVTPQQGSIEEEIGRKGKAKAAPEAGAGE
jgi:hypothetical protein